MLKKYLQLLFYFVSFFSCISTLSPLPLPWNDSWENIIDKENYNTFRNTYELEAQKTFLSNWIEVAAADTTITTNLEKNFFKGKLTTQQTLFLRSFSICYFYWLQNSGNVQNYLYKNHLSTEEKTKSAEIIHYLLHNYVIKFLCTLFIEEKTDFDVVFSFQSFSSFLISLHSIYAVLDYCRYNILDADIKKRRDISIFVTKNTTNNIYQKVIKEFNDSLFQELTNRNAIHADEKKLIADEWKKLENEWEELIKKKKQHNIQVKTAGASHPLSKLASAGGFLMYFTDDDNNMANKFVSKKTKKRLNDLGCITFTIGTGALLYYFLFKSN